MAASLPPQPADAARPPKPGPTSGVPNGQCALALAAAGGDTQAFETLTALYEVRLFNLLRSMVATPEDAQEVLQQALLHIHLGLPRMKVPHHDAMLSAWMFRVAVNAGLMHLRAKRRRPVLHLEDVTSPTARQNNASWPVSAPLGRPDHRLLRAELNEHLHLAIRALPDKYRLVLWLRDIEEQSNEEVAQTLGLTVPTVKARLLRARAVVRSALETYVT